MTLLVIYLAIAIGVSFLCSILEAVLLSISPSFVETTNAEKPTRAGKLREIRDNLDESLSSILILNTFAHTMGAAGVGSQAMQVFGAEWETLIAVLLTLAILYFSEIIPKTLGATFWRQLAIPAAYVISWLVKLVYPLVWLSTRLTKLFSSNQSNEITREEIIALASLGHREGNLFTQENEYLSNLLSLREITTEKILTPRSVVHMLSTETSISDALNDPLTRQFTRIPVYGEHVDDVIGKVIRADLYEAERDGKGNECIGTVMKPLFRVSNKLPVQSLLDTFIKQRAHLFLVTDEFGQNEGVVSLEDAIETLLGREIVDETDTVEDMQAFAKASHKQRMRDEKQDRDSHKSSSTR
ncbi:transporter [Oleiphilus sp. HI0071]|uniref:CNNM domain-containing protein n=1 Tax=unclassified Oleiphilus TaxID=2631174 RepID=UPI0007C39909|nr:MULTISPECIES: CNNM domain-containing protein [unclassified Oleiphilus]KZY72611.1 transporter [Oleiphilus sp. HI0065]KZY82810.1 transporter [Oleiphilus sp. HI0071]KZZ04879.1 transporter [Oleiphilus sp. HI0073]KZZ43817.1 transporter [Oleiphilus sp. HI0118]KZZ56656.1 transporter [Oleiphilus sp. HI0122]KZZ72279.1 transporter [Oleiphilus sp. HI0130]KZZ80869.1 transporter [Oleiphilus sp. HI0133]